MDRILIIEDEKPIRDMVRFALNDLPFELFEAETSKQALSVIQRNKPAVILLDWMLPNESGVVFLKKLRQHKEYQHIPVIMLTARAEEDN